MNIGCPGTPGSDEILAAMNVATEDADVGFWVGLRDANERYKTIPGSDATIEVVVLPGLAMGVERLSEHHQHEA